jgi:HSP20 family protein
MAELVKKESKNDVATVERTRSGPTFVPRFDILENDDELTLFGDLPGVCREDLDIRFENNQLVVHGRVAPRHENREFIYGEYGIGDFYRVFTIGEAVDSSKISAELKDGTLVLHLPKTEAVKPRKIAVKAG